MQHKSRIPEAMNVTTAQRSHTDDIALRQQRYIMLQSGRIMCVVLATALPVSGLFTAALIGGAVLLPWFSVVLANAGPSITRSRPSALKQTLGNSVVQTEGFPARLALSSSKIIDAEK